MQCALRMSAKRKSKPETEIVRPHGLAGKREGVCEIGKGGSGVRTMRVTTFEQATSPLLPCNDSRP